MRLPLLFLSLSIGGCGLTLEAVPRSTGGVVGDGGTVDAPRDGETGDGDGDGATDAIGAGDTSTVGDAASTDAAPPVATDVLTIPNAGPHGSQPAVIWDGAEHVIGLIVAGQVELRRMPPGTMVDVPELITTSGDSSRQDVVLSHDGGSVAVGWTHSRGGVGELVVRVVPDDPTERTIATNLARSSDRQEAALYATTSGFGAIVRGSDGAGGQTLAHVDIDTRATGMLSRSSSFGELDLEESSGLPLLAYGEPQSIWQRLDAGWDLGATVTLSRGSEAGVAMMADGSVATVWLHDDVMGGRRFSFTRHRPVSGWSEEGPTRLDLPGSDPALAPFEDGVLLAFAYPDTVGRTLGLVALDASGTVVAGPCRVAPVQPVANDPDVACGGGYCAVAWIEGSAYSADDFATRIIQVPEDRSALCP